MKKVKAILIMLVIFGGIIAVLMNNKAKSDQKSVRRDVITRLPVSVIKADRQELEHNLSLVGTIVANNDVNVVSETQGRVVALYAQVGDYKPAGSVIARVDDELKRAALTTAEISLEKAKSDLQRYSQLHAEQAVSDQQIESARLAVRAAEAQVVTASRLLRDTRITAPISGVVTSRMINLGSTLSPGMALLNLVDISRLKVQVNVAEQDVFKLRIGDRVTITTDVYPGVDFDGRVQNISSKSDAAHTYAVEISLANSSQHPLKAGMFGRVSFNSIPKSNVLMIPREAVIGSVQNPQVFVVHNGTAKLRSVVLGSESGTKVEVLKGLSVGELIVVDGQNNLQDNTEVQVVK